MQKSGSRAWLVISLGRMMTPQDVVAESLWLQERAAALCVVPRAAPGLQQHGKGSKRKQKMAFFWQTGLLCSQVPSSFSFSLLFHLVPSNPPLASCPGFFHPSPWKPSATTALFPPAWWVRGGDSLIPQPPQGLGGKLEVLCLPQQSKEVPAACPALPSPVLLSLGGCLCSHWKALDLMMSPPSSSGYTNLIF